MKRFFVLLLLFFSNFVLSQFSDEAISSVKEVELKEIKNDISIVQKKQNLLSRINESLKDLNEWRKEKLEYVEKQKKKWEKLGVDTSVEAEMQTYEQRIKNKKFYYKTLLYIIEFSENLYVDFEWYKGFMSSCKLVLIDENGVKYGGTNWTGISLLYETNFDCKNYDKIKNKELLETIISGSLVVGSESSRTGLTAKNYNINLTPRWFIYEHLKKYGENEKGYIDYKFGDF